MGLTPEVKPPLTAATPDVDAEALVERVAQGDRAALLALFDRAGSLLLAVAARVTGDRAEAEDVVQETLLRVWHEAPRFDRARGSASTWLVTLARNRAIDRVRARRRRGHYEESVEPPAAPSATPEGAVFEAHRAAAVRCALAALKPEVRAVLELSYFSGLSHSEISERTGQPLGTVKTRIAQGVRALRDALAAFSDPGDLGD